MMKGVIKTERALEISEKLASAVWGVPTIALLVGVGVFYTVRLKFFQFRHPGLWLSNTFFAIFKKENVRNHSDKKSLSQFQAMATTLAATIGTGNIAGVAAAIAAGGPGAVFWMWLCSLISMMTSYSENLLGIYYRHRGENGEWRGGPMYYLKEGLSKNRHSAKAGLVLAYAFSAFTLLASFGIGNMSQSNSISVVFSSSLNISPYITGAIVAVITFVAIGGGVARIGAITEKLVPFMALFYISASLYIVICNIQNAPAVFSSIIRSAFSLRSATGGIGGAALGKCISIGFKRGVFSNEAGLGSTVLVGSSSNVKEPAIQGMWGIFQVFVDTTVICTVTAFVLLSTTVNAVPLRTAINNLSENTQYVLLDESKQSSEKVFLSDTHENSVYTLAPDNTIEKGAKSTYSNIMSIRGVRDKESGRIKSFVLEEIEGAALVSLAFNCVFGKWADIILSVSVALFALSTIMGWSFYGIKSIDFIFGERKRKAYIFVFSLLSFFGAIARLDLVWCISDIFNGLMAIPNLFGIVLLSKDVIAVTNNFLRRQSGEKLTALLNIHGEY